MYNPKSLKAEEFIDHQEILDTLEYADKNKDNVEVIDAILKKRGFAKALPTVKLPSCWPATFPRRFRSFILWPSRSKRTSTATAS